jgi:amino acid permease
MVTVYAGREIVPHTHYPFLELRTFPLFFGIAVFSFAMHGVILSIDESAQNKEFLPRVMDWTVVLVVAVYLTFGAVGYAG